MSIWASTPASSPVALCTSHRIRGCRAFEIYSNTFAYDAIYFFPFAVNIRSGTGVIFGNKVSGVKYLTGIYNYRNAQRFAPWGGANGLSPWDNVLATNVISGTHDGANAVNYLQVSTANWNVNQWVGYTVVNKDFTSTNWNFSTVTSNSPTRMFFNSSKDNGFMAFSTGQHFVLHQIYPIMDQPGRGAGDLVVGEQQPWGPDPTVASAGVAKWPNQVSEPIYAWNNTLDGAAKKIACDYPNIQEGRDFFNDIPKPGYTPLPYPHPLQGGTNSSSGSSGGGAALTPPPQIWVQLN